MLVVSTGVLRLATSTTATVADHLTRHCFYFWHHYHVVTALCPRYQGAE